MSVLQRKTAPKNYLFKLTIACFEWINFTKKTISKATHKNAKHKFFNNDGL